MYQTLGIKIISGPVSILKELTVMAVVDLSVQLNTCSQTMLFSFVKELYVLVCLNSGFTQLQDFAEKEYKSTFLYLSSLKMSYQKVLTIHYNLHSILDYSFQQRNIHPIPSTQSQVPLLFLPEQFLLGWKSFQQLVPFTVSPSFFQNVQLLLQILSEWLQFYQLSLGSIRPPLRVNHQECVLLLCLPSHEGKWYDLHSHRGYAQEDVVKHVGSIFRRPVSLVLKVSLEAQSIRITVVNLEDSSNPR